MVEPPSMVGLGLCSFATHDVSYDGFFKCVRIERVETVVGQACESVLTKLIVLSCSMWSKQVHPHEGTHLDQPYGPRAAFHPASVNVFVAAIGRHLKWNPRSPESLWTCAMRRLFYLAAWRSGAENTFLNAIVFHAGSEICFQLLHPMHPWSKLWPAKLCFSLPFRLLCSLHFLFLSAWCHCGTWHVTFAPLTLHWPCIAVTPQEKKPLSTSTSASTSTAAFFVHLSWNEVWNAFVAWCVFFEAFDLPQWIHVFASRSCFKHLCKFQSTLLVTHQMWLEINKRSLKMLREKTIVKGQKLPTTDFKGQHSAWQHAET